MKSYRKYPLVGLKFVHELTGRTTLKYSNVYSHVVLQIRPRGRWGDGSGSGVSA